MEDAQIIDLYWKRDESAITETARKYGALCRTVAKGILSTAEQTRKSASTTHTTRHGTPSRPSARKSWGRG